MVRAAAKTPSAQAFRSARAKLERAAEDIVTACQMLRDAGLPESAAELMAEARRIRVWTQRDGWLDHIDPERRARKAAP